MDRKPPGPGRRRAGPSRHRRARAPRQHRIREERVVTALAVTVAGAYGVWLIYTAAVFGWRGVRPGPALARRRQPRRTAADWLAQAGLQDVGVSEFSAVVGALFVVGAGVAFALFGGVLPPLTAGLLAGLTPVASYRGRRERRRAAARESWPRMIEEMRLLTGSLGRSIPQALFDVGRTAPADMHPAFRAAEREWL